MGFINQLITGGHHPATTMRVLYVWLSGEAINPRIPRPSAVHGYWLETAATALGK